MSKVLIEEQTLQDIADAIRETTGTLNTLRPSDMPTAIADSESSGTLYIMHRDIPKGLAMASGQEVNYMPAGVIYADRSGAEWTPTTMTIDGETVPSVTTPQMNGYIYVIATPIDISKYKKLFITLSISDDGSSYHLADLYFYSRPVITDKYGVSSYGVGAINLRRKDQYITNQIDDIMNQPGIISLLINNDLSISPQTFIFDLSTLGHTGEIYMGLYSYHTYFSVREIYCTA